MPITCSAFGCTNRYVAGGNLQFFGFPLKNEEILSLWLLAVNRKDFKPSKFSKLCSDHFLEKDYQPRPGAYIKQLKPDAVPSVFPACSSNYINKKQQQKNYAFEIVDCDNIKIDETSVLDGYDMLGTSLDQANEVQDPLSTNISTISQGTQTEVDATDIEGAILEMKHKLEVLLKEVRRRKKNLIEQALKLIDDYKKAKI